MNKSYINSFVLCLYFVNYTVFTHTDNINIVNPVAETVVCPIPFLINMFTALKGSQFYFYLLVIDYCWWFCLNYLFAGFAVIKS